MTITSPGFLDQGQHLVTAIADFTCLYDEENETDNTLGPVTLTAAAPVMPDFTINAPLRPDLTIDAITVHPSGEPDDKYYVRQPISYTVAVRNAGTKASSTASLRLFLDSMPALCNAGGWLNAVQVPSIPAGQSTNIVVASLPIDTAGPHSLWGVVDATLTESNKDNNRYGPQTIIVSPPPLPDLDVQVQPLPMAVGGRYENQWITSLITVTNLGAGTSAASLLGLYRDHFPADCPTLDTADVGAFVPALWAGQTYTRTLTTRFDSQGPHTLRAKVDYGCKIDEIFESNNVDVYNLSVYPGPKPDLVVESIEISPSPPFAEEWATVRTTVRNEGLAASDSTYGGMYIGRGPSYLCPLPVGGAADVGDTVFYIPPLEPGASSTFEVPNWLTEEGARWLYAFVDYPCRTEESDEVNNLKLASFDLRPPRLPDLIVENVSVDPASPLAGQPVTFNVVVRNRGAAPSRSATWVGLYRDRNAPECPTFTSDSGDLVAQLGPLTAGQSQALTFRDVFTEGYHAIEFQPDYTCAIAESDEANNSRYPRIDLSVGPVALPDLIVESIVLDPPSPTVNQTINFSMTVKNVGTAASSWAWSGIYFDRAAPGCPRSPAGDDGSIGDRVVQAPPLNAGESITLGGMRAYFTTLGRHGVFGFADYGCTLAEVSKANNRLWEVPFMVGESSAVDLVVTNLVAEPTVLERGETATFTASVKNQGAATSSGAQLGLYIDRMPDSCPFQLSAYESADIPVLVPGETRDVVLTHTFALAEPHDVRVFADWTCAAPESNEMNNLSNPVSLAIEPGTLPDLVVTSLTTQPAAPVAGQPITFTAVVANAGFGDAAMTRVGIYSGSPPQACSVDALTVGNVPPLAKDASATVEFVGTVGAGGQYGFYALADDACAVTEYRENNNGFGPLTRSVAGLPSPDLSTSLVNYTPLEPKAGEPVTYTVQIRNDGAAAVNNPAASVGLYLNRPPLGCSAAPDHLAALPIIGAGETKTVMIEDTGGFASGGDQSVYVLADRTCAVREPNETNNRYGPIWMSVASLPRPDLQVTSLIALPSNPAVGDLVRFVARVKNAGTDNMPEGAGARLGLYLDATPAPCTDPQPALSLPVPALLKGVSQDFLFEYGSFAKGAHAARAFVDYTCALGELDDANNAAGPVTVAVGAPLTPTPTPTPSPTPPATTHDYAFLALAPETGGAGGGLQVVGVDDASSPQATEFLALAGEPQGVALTTVGGVRYALVAAGATGLHVVNVAAPASPQLVSTLDTPGAATGVAAFGDFAYVADSTTGLGVINLADAGAPVAVTYYDTPGVAWDVATWSPVAGQVYAAVADGAAGLTILDITTPGSPLLLSQYDTPGEGLSVTLAGSLAYVADGSAGVTVVDLSTPSEPQFAALSETPGSARAVAVGAGGAGAFAYVADTAQGLRIVNPLTVSPTSQACDAAGNCTAAARAGVAGVTAVARAGQGATQPASGFIVSEAATRLASMQVAGVQRGKGVAGSNGGPAVAEEPVYGFTLRRMLTAVDADDPVYATISGLPPVLDSLAPVEVGGQATAMNSTLKSLRVSADGEPILIQEWAAGDLSDLTWSARWTPATNGQHVLQAVAKDQADAWASALYTVTVDTDLPTISVSSLVITSTAVYPVNRIDLTGLVTDTGGISSVEFSTSATGEWAPALLNEQGPGESGPVEWRGPWSLSSPLPDGSTFNIRARVTDLAGHTSQISVPVRVDVSPPSGADLSLSAAGVPVAPGGTVTQAGAELDLAWTTGADGSGLTPYTVRWTTQATATLTSETVVQVPVAGPLTASFTPGEGRRVMAQRGMQDTLGNQTWRTLGPLDVDSQVTPDYCVLPGQSTAQGGTLALPPPLAWMNSGCTLIGVDRRVATTGLGEQRLYATWNVEALRLAWTGANWHTDGDLFVYLDTRSGGTTRAYNPYLAENAGGLVADQTVITLPSEMTADYLVWVRDAGDAVLLTWNGGEWDWAATLDVSMFQTWTGAGRASDTGRGQTDLYLPFNLLGITGNGSTNALKLLAIASEQDALHIWAALPASNGVNSSRTLPDGSPAGLDLTLDHAYEWPALGPGICPNGSNGSGTAFFTAAPEISLVSEPAGTAFSLLSDSLYWLRDLLLGSPPADVSTHLSDLTPGQPRLGSGSPVTYTLTYRNAGEGTARGARADMSALCTLRLNGGQEQTLNLGDVEPGEQASVVLHGTVDLGLSAEPWIALAIQVYDSAHPVSDQPVDWLWAHQPVDRSAPLFFGIDRPAYLLRSGENTLTGYAYDPSGVNSISFDVRAGRLLNHPLP